MQAVIGGGSLVVIREIRIAWLVPFCMMGGLLFGLGQVVLVYCFRR
ncbi:hypothetical protein [Gimesia maris]